MPNYKVDTILNIRRITSQLKDRGNTVDVYWILGQIGFAENTLTDSLAKEPAKMVVDSQEVL